MKAMRALGYKPMPWQQQVADVAGEFDPETGLPFFGAVVVLVPRQSGKTALNQAVAFERAMRSGFWRGDPGGGGGLLWVPGGQRVVYTAQSGIAARRKLFEPPEGWYFRFSRHVPFLLDKPVLSAGREAIVLQNTSLITLEAGTEDAGHGPSNHLVIQDEKWADVDDRRDDALSPTMQTVEDSQDWTSSTAGTPASTPLLRIRDQGRDRCEDPGTSVAYFEWSAPEDADPDDESVWRACSPALGFTQTIRKLRQAREKSTDAAFRRAYLNQWVDDGEEGRVIPAAEWATVCHHLVECAEPLTYAADATSDLASAAVAVADPQHRVELGVHRPGIAWLGDYLEGLSQRHDGARVAVDVGGPIGGLADHLERRGVTVVRLGTRDMQHASQGFLTGVLDRKVAVRSSTDLDAAAATAVRRKVGESWMWARGEGSAPIVAASMALYAARDPDSIYDPMSNIW